MSGTYALQMGDRGRLVVPAEVRERLHLVAGTPVLLLETDDGLVLTTREHARRLLSRQLDGESLLTRLLEERRRAAGEEDG